MTDAMTVSCEPRAWAEEAGRLCGQGYDFFDFLCAVDQLDDVDRPGFDLVLHLYDVTPGELREIFLVSRLPDGETASSLTRLWPGAAWHERETYEMFGIEFTDFVDSSGRGLRPLLLPEGFEGTPLRKSFVLASRASKPWPGAKEPGEGAAAHAVKAGRAPRRKLQPPGVPDESWGPR